MKRQIHFIQMSLNLSEHGVKIGIHVVKFVFHAPCPWFSFHAYGENSQDRFSRESHKFRKLFVRLICATHRPRHPKLPILDALRLRL